MAESIDMINGPLFKKIVLFTIPIMFQSLLQTLYNSADIVVVGRFANDGGLALAAVGATSSVFNAFVGFFTGIATGVDIFTSMRYGMGDKKGLKEAIDTSVILAPILGIAVMVAGLIFTEPVLVLMKTPVEGGVLEAAVRYMRITMIGVPFIIVYNFVAAILRTGGETVKPSVFLTVSGLLNVILNIVFVAGFKMAEVGVGVATVISQILSATLILILLFKNKGYFSFSFKNINFSINKFGNIVVLGILAGLQSSMFGISNTFMQSGVNSFGQDAISGSSAAATVEGIFWCTSVAPLNAATTFVSQNVGANKPDRVNKVTIYTVLISAGIGGVLGVGGFLLREPLMHLFTDVPQAIQYGAERATITFPVYFLASIMGTLPGAIRGLGYSLQSTIISIVGACGIRIIWIYTAFKYSHTMTTLYLVHPITWAITAASFVVCYMICFKKFKKKAQKLNT